MIWTRNLSQVATLWPFLGVDRFGQSSFGQPVTIRCRWQDQAVLYRDAQGQQQISSAIIYPDRVIALKSYLKQGVDLTASPVGLDGAYEVRNVGQSPSLDARITLIKVWV